MGAYDRGWRPLGQEQAGTQLWLTLRPATIETLAGRLGVPWQDPQRHSDATFFSVRAVPALAAKLAPRLGVAYQALVETVVGGELDRHADGRCTIRRPDVVDVEPFRFAACDGGMLADGWPDHVRFGVALTGTDTPVLLDLAPCPWPRVAVDARHLVISEPLIDAVADIRAVLAAAVPEFEGAELTATSTVV